MTAAVGAVDRTTGIMLTAAATWALGLVVAAMTVPLYGSESFAGSSPATPGVASTSIRASYAATLVQVNGFRVLIPVAAPLVAVALVAVALIHRHKGLRAGPGPIVSGVVALLGVGTLAAMLSIGVFLIPVDALLVAVCIRASNPDG